MPETAESLPVLPVEEEETTAGNYFVANYPPFSLWTPERAGEALEKLDSPGDSETQMGMYVHIPFCRKRCHFCYFKVYTDKNARQIGDYLDSMLAEANRLAEKPFAKDRALRFVYFGGGTPSYLSDRQLTHLFEGLQRAFPWDDVEEVAFECEPGTLTEKKIQAIRNLGVTRLSLGIENFDDEILELNNRAHKSKEVYQAYEWAKAAGFPQINIDLIAGMLGETSENWRRCIDKTLELAPDAVTIYQMEIPYNTTIYQDMKAQGREIAPVADWATKRRWVREAFSQLEEHGYTVGSAYTAVKDSEDARFVYRDALWSGADMLAVGVSSFGYLDGVHYQNETQIDAYINAVKEGQLPVLRAMTTTDEEQMIRQFVLQMKLGRVSTRRFRQNFGINVLERYKDIFQTYEDAGYLRCTNGTIELTRKGLLQVDRLLHAFFLPEHRGVRYT